MVLGGGPTLLLILLYLPFTLLAPVGSAAPVLTKTAVTTGARAEPVFPGYGGSAVGAVGWDGLLASSGQTTPRPMASVTKIVTAMVILDAKPLATGEAGPTITLTERDVGYYLDAVRQNGTVAVAKAGIRYSERDMLTVTLVKSANNYATSMAVWAYGSMEAYLAAARAWLDARGLTSTAVTDASGLDPGSVSTPADLVALGKLALADPVVADIVDEKSFQVHDAGLVKNTNSMLGSYGVVGIKTGTLTGAGSNLLFATRLNIGGTTVTAIGAVLGGPSHRQVVADVKALITSVKAGFHRVTVAKRGTVLADYRTRWGQRTQAVASRAGTVVVWSDTPVTVTVSARPAGVSVAGTRVGTATYSAGRSTVTVPLSLSTPLTDPGPGWRLTNPFALGG